MAAFGVRRRRRDRRLRRPPRCCVQGRDPQPPSALEPFGGANTGVGGVVRDVIGVSARPIACAMFCASARPICRTTSCPPSAASPSHSRWCRAGIGDYEQTRAAHRQRLGALRPRLCRQPAGFAVPRHPPHGAARPSRVGDRHRPRWAGRPRWHSRRHVLAGRPGCLHGRSCRLRRADRRPDHRA